MTELTPKQFTAIEIQLATAPKIQDDLKAKFGYGENKFFDLDLFEYRVNNSRLDIAEDLDVKSLYGLTTDKVAEESVSRAFRGHHNEDFKPEYRFEGLLGKITNNYIEGIGYEINGRKVANMINPETEERYVVEAGRIGYANGLANLTPEERSEHSRIGGQNKRGRGFWQTHPELLEDIVELRNEGLTWNDTTDEFNRRHGTDYKSDSLRSSYQNNKHRLTDEEE